VEWNDAEKMVNRAIDLGITFIDTARNYRDSEEKIGQVLKDRRDECIIATKTANREASGVMKELEISLNNLKTDVIDLYQLHIVSDGDTYKKVMSTGGALEAAKKAKAQGKVKVKHIGITIHRDIDTMKSAIKSDEFETLMVAYSPLDQEGVADEILPMAKEHDMGVITMKPLSGGLLCLPEHERGDSKTDAIASGSIRFIIANENVTVAIPGVTNIREVEENASIGAMPPISDEEIAELLKYIGSQKKEYRYGQLCLRCGYCQPCPQEIEIPVVFRALEVFKSYPEDLKHIGVDLYMSLKVKPDSCKECEKCMKKCPAGLNIPERLKEALDVFNKYLAQAGA